MRIYVNFIHTTGRYDVLVHIILLLVIQMDIILNIGLMLK